MRILVVHCHYMGAANEKVGGEKTAIDSFVSEMRSRGHEIREYLRDNREIRDYSGLQKALFFPRAIYSRRTVRELAQIVAEFRPDVAHVQNVYPLISPSAYIALHRADVPIVQMVQNYRFLCPNGLFYTHGRNCELCAKGNTWHAVRLKCYHESRLLSGLYAAILAWHRRRGTFRMIDRFIVLNEFTRDEFLQHGLTTPDRIRLGGNFLRLDGTERDAAPRGRNVVYVGRLSAEKGVRTFVEAMRFAPDVQADIMGSGPEQDDLAAMIAEYKLTNVRLLGFVPEEEMIRRLSTAAASVTPSVCYEGLPYAVLQSMAYGTPVIASRIGGMPEALRDGACGWLFEPGDPQSLAAAIRDAATRPDVALEKSVASRATFREKYHRDAVYGRLLDVYRELSRAQSGERRSRRPEAGGRTTD